MGIAGGETEEDFLEWETIVLGTRNLGKPTVGTVRYSLLENVDELQCLSA